MKARVRDYFRLIVNVNLILCILTFAGMIVFAFIDEIQLTSLQNQTYSTCETVFKMSAGAFIGLIGGRATK